MDLASTWIDVGYLLEFSQNTTPLGDPEVKVIDIEFCPKAFVYNCVDNTCLYEVLWSTSLNNKCLWDGQAPFQVSYAVRQ